MSDNRSNADAALSARAVARGSGTPAHARGRNPFEQPDDQAAGVRSLPARVAARCRVCNSADMRAAGRRGWFGRVAVRAVCAHCGAESWTCEAPVTKPCSHCSLPAREFVPAVEVMMTTIARFTNAFGRVESHLQCPRCHRRAIVLPEDIDAAEQAPTKGRRGKPAKPGVLDRLAAASSKLEAHS